MTPPRLLIGTILLILFQTAFSQQTQSQADPKHNRTKETNVNKEDGAKNVTQDLKEDLTEDAAEAVHETVVPSNNQVSKLGVDTPGAEEYEDDPSDDLEIQASGHEVEAVYSGVEAGRGNHLAEGYEAHEGHDVHEGHEGHEERPKKRRRRRRRKRRKRIRTSTTGYEDNEKSADLADLPPAPLELETPYEGSGYGHHRRRPIKRRRKPSTPIPIEEEYLLAEKHPRRPPVVPSAAPNSVPSSRVPPAAPRLVPSIATSIPSHIPENIEEIIEQPTQDSLKIKAAIVNNLPPIVVIPTDSGVPLLVPLPAAVAPARNISRLEGGRGNFTQGPLDPKLLTPHGKQNKINVRLSEPLLFVTAPQGIDYNELSKVTQAVRLTATSSPSIDNATHLSTSKPTVASTPSKTIVASTPSSHNGGTLKNASSKKLLTASVHSLKDIKENTRGAPKEILNENRESTSTTEKVSSEVRKPIRRPPPVGTLFRKRPPTPHTTEAAKSAEDTTVSKENELAELKLYTESPLELQKLAEIPPTSKTNAQKVKDAQEKEISENIVYRRDEKLKHPPTTGSPVKYTSTSVIVRQSSETHSEKQSPLKQIPFSPQPVKHGASSSHTAYTPNIDLIIDYTYSTRKPVASSTPTTEKSIQVDIADESLNTISHSEDIQTSGDDQATRIDLEIPQVKDDILIFLKSKAESNKLSRILQSRNMTLEELIEHRERGSSQLHLAEIFKNSPKAIPEADFDLSPPLPPASEEPPMLGSFPNSISQEVHHRDSSDNRQPKFLFDGLSQFPPMEAEASQTVYSFTTKSLPDLQYRRPRPLLPNAKLTPFYGSSDELLLSYTTSTGRPVRLLSDDLVSIRELHEPTAGNKRIPSELKSVITISGAIIAFAVLGFFVLLISCKVRHRKSQKFIKAGILREHLREATLRSSTRSDNTPVVKNGYYAGCDHTSDTSSTARQTYLWKTIRKTFRYE